MKIKYLLSLVIIMIITLQCSQREVGIKNVKINVQIFDSITKSPVPKANVSIYQIKKTFIVSYFNQVKLLEEKFTDKTGHVNFNIDSLGKYYIQVFRKDDKLWGCSDVFDSNEIDLKKKYIIQCPN